MILRKTYNLFLRCTLMLKEITKFFGHSAIYGLSGAIGTLLSVLLVPVYTRVLSPEEYGIVSLVVVVSSIANIVAGMGMGSALFWAYYKASEEEKASVIGTTFWLSNVFALITALLLALTSPNISYLIIGDTTLATIIRIVSLVVAFQASLSFPLAFLRIHKHPLKYVSITLLKSFIAVLAIIFLVVYMKMGVLGVFVGHVVGAVVGLIVSYLYVRDRIKFSFDKAWAKQILAFGIPMMPSGLAMWILNSSDRYFLNYLDGPAAVGIYAVGYKVGMIIALAVSAFQIAFGPLVFSAYEEKEDPRRFYIHIVKYMFLILVTLAFGVALFGKEAVKYVVGPQFQDAYIVIPFIAYSYLGLALYNLFSIGVSLKRKTYLSTVAVGLTGAINFALNYLLIGEFSMVGAAIATLLSFFILALFELYFSQRQYPIAFQYKEMGWSLVVSGGLLLVIHVLPFSGIVSLLIKGVGVLLYFALVYYFVTFSKQEREKLKKILVMFKTLREGSDSRKKVIHFISEL